MSFFPFRSEKAKKEYAAFYSDKSKGWPIASENRMLNTSFGDTYIKVSGPSGAPPLVLLANNSLAWMGSIKILSKSFRTYVIDNIFGFGLSVPKRKAKCSGDYVLWLDEVLNGLGLSHDINLVGQFKGGWIAAMYAVKNNNRVKKLILISPNATILPFSFIFHIWIILLSMPLRIFTILYINTIFKEYIRLSKSLKLIAKNIADEIYFERHSYIRQEVHENVLTDKEMASLGSSVYLIIGSNEIMYSAKDAKMRTLNLLPHAKVDVLEDVGHEILMAKSSVVNAMMNNYLLGKNDI